MKNYYFFLMKGPNDGVTEDHDDDDYWVDDHQCIGLLSGK